MTCKGLRKVSSTEKVISIRQLQILVKPHPNFVNPSQHHLFGWKGEGLLARKPRQLASVKSRDFLSAAWKRSGERQGACCPKQNLKVQAQAPPYGSSASLAPAWVPLEALHLGKPPRLTWHSPLSTLALHWEEISDLWQKGSSWQAQTAEIAWVILGSLTPSAMTI